MRYFNSSKVSLLSFTLLIFSAGIIEAVNPEPTKAGEIRDADSLSTLLIAQATPQATPQVVSSPVTPGTGNPSSGEGTLWWLLLLCLGLPFLLAWLGSKKKTKTVNPSTLILTPETGHTARVYWEIPPEKVKGLRQQGGANLAIRLTDVTNLNPQVTTPKLVQQVNCSLGSPLISLQVPEIDREYQAELGCVTDDGGWISLARSAPAYFPAPRPFLGGLGAGIVTAIGSTAISSFEPQSETPKETSLPQVVNKVEVIKNPINPISSKVEDLAVDLWNDPAPQIIADSGIADSETVESKVAESKVAESEILQPNPDAIDNPETMLQTNPDAIDIIDNSETVLQSNTVLQSKLQSNTEELSVEMEPSISSVVPTVDDGGSSLNWGVIGGVAAAEFVQRQEDEVLVDTTPSPRINLILSNEVNSDEATINQVQPPLVEETHIHLHIHTPDQGYVYWEIAPRDEQNLKSQGCEDLILRIHDSTNIDIDYTSPHTTQEYACNIDQSDRYVPIMVGDRPHADYIAELGYITNTGDWLRIIRSLHTRFFS